MEDRITFIYGLYEEGKEDEIRYVGKSLNIKDRLRSHITKFDSNVNKSDWIRDVLSRGGKIKLRVLEECTSNWNEREIFWVSEFKKTGLITNIRIGGENNKYYTITYNECKKWVSDNLPEINTRDKWIDNSKNLPLFIPRYPSRLTGFTTWGEFLGTGRVHNIELTKDYLSYNDAKDTLKDLNIKSISDWKIKFNSGLIPKNIPKSPSKYYKKRGWISWGDFTSNGNIRNCDKTFISYEECKIYANDNGIHCQTKWFEHFKKYKPLGIPSLPPITYKNNWISWNEFFNRETRNIQRVFLSYDESKKLLSENNIKSSKDFRNFKRNKTKIYNIPSHPENYYKEWISWDEYFK
jgi:hypothetical protein